MREIRALIVDDEPLARRGIRQLLEREPDVTVVGEARDGREALRALRTLEPTLVFLDVQMPELDGFEVIRRRTPERMPLVVFLTAYDRFALQGFEAEAVDYLVKPVSDARFAATVHRLARGLASRADAERSLVVTTARGTLILPLRDIDWIEAADYYARVWVGARSYLLRESLTQLERRVASAGFVRAHRQALVRVGSVRALRTNDDGETVAILTNGATVPVSRRRRALLSAAVRRSSN